MPIRPSSSIALSNWALCSSRLLIVLRENEPPSTTLSPVLSPQTPLQVQFVYIDRDGELGAKYNLYILIGMGSWEESGTERESGGRRERVGDEERESALVGKRQVRRYHEHIQTTS
ncbi:hypothetical protein PRUPE_2G078400 [Prunus persica]|uniref:Uncharacterized protein n=1 Tax=Prunus persica TaxID=3760 RepID=A0A251QCX6_PRUPE|nr:hypothetical protein PRUPE_2G078400 [Prunus persica]